MPVTATTSTARRARTEKRRTASSLARRAVSASTTSPPIQAPTASRCTTSRGRNSQRGARPVSCASSASVTTAPAGGGRGGQKRAHRAGTEPADGGRAGSHLPGQPDGADRGGRHRQGPPAGLVGPDRLWPVPDGQGGDDDPDQP